MTADLMTGAEVARLCCVTADTVRKWRRERKLSPVGPRTVPASPERFDVIGLGRVGNYELNVDNEGAFVLRPVGMRVIAVRLSQEEAMSLAAAIVHENGVRRREAAQPEPKTPPKKGARRARNS